MHAQENTLPEDEADVVKCRFWRLVKKEVYEEWSEANFVVNTGRPAEGVEVSGIDGRSAHGTRHRLLV